MSAGGDSEGRRAELAALGGFLADLGIDASADALPLFQQAMTHRSHAAERAGADNERLEFLGDAVLGAAASEHLYAKHPNLAEGELSKLRSRLVSREMLGKRAAEMGLGGELRMGVGERRGGGATRLSNLGCALEALIGAVFHTAGYPAARDFVLRAVIGPIDAAEADEPTHGDYKSALQEWTQSHLGALPEYRRVGESGPDHDKRFAIEVWVAGEPWARAEAPRIKQAEVEAARLAYEKAKGRG